MIFFSFNNHLTKAGGTGVVGGLWSEESTTLVDGKAVHLQARRVEQEPSVICWA